MARNLRIASVVVDLVANSARYIASLRKANQDTRRYTRSMQRSFNHLSRNIAGMAAGYLGFAAVINQFNKTLANAKEIDIMAQLAGQSVEDFQAAAYASNQFGISAEKLGDISKDVQDKLGDFIATGGGEFKDFFEQVAPKVGLTADQLQGLSGPDVLLRVKKAMDDANVPMEQQIFYLESIANDASKLIPLLADGGREYNRLTGEAKDLNLVLSKQDITTLRDMDKEINKVTQRLNISFATAVIGASDQIHWLTEQLAEAVVFWGAFFDSFRDEPKTIEGLNNKLVDLQEELDELDQRIKNPTEFQGDDAVQRTEQETEQLLIALRRRKIEAQKEYDAIQKLKNRAMGVPDKPYQPPVIQPLPKIETGGNDTGTVTATAKKTANDIIKENQRLLDSLTRTFATQEQLINQNYLKQVEQINALQLTKAQLDKAGYDNLLQLQSDYLLQAEAVREEALTRLKAQTEEANDQQATSFDGLAKAINASTDTMAMAATNWANSFSTELANMVTKGQMDFGRLAESIINDILRIAIQANITQPLLQGMGLVPGKAIGGPVMRGQTYLVGEKGPELFTASNSGNITPNHKLGGNTQVNIYTQPGETAETRSRQTEQGDIIEVFMKQVDSRMNEQISRGQGLARTLEGRYALSRKSY